jgi:diguanylate cyclase (GGDEF)-like protein
MGAREEWLRPLKRRIYTVVAALGIAASVFALIINELSGQSPSFVRGVLLAAAGFCALLLLLLRTEAPLRWVEELLYAGTGAIFLSVFFFALYAAEHHFQAENSLLGLYLWLPMVYVLAFLVHESRPALFRSALFYILLVAVSLPHALSYITSRMPPEGPVYTSFEQLYFSNAVIIALLFFFARLKERLREVQLNAERMERLARTDPLTGVANRRRIEQLLEAEVEKAGAEGRRLSLITFDIDDFKQINDLFGHDAGDSVLAQVARTVESHLRAGDHFGRWGGEEFVILAPGMSLEMARGLADRVRTVLQDQDFDPIGTLSASFGVAELQPGDSPTTLVKRADVAVYRAKTRGKNRVEAHPGAA